MKYATAVYKLSTAAVHVDSSVIPDKFYWNRLEVTIHSAFNLKAADSAIFGGKSDPYVMMEALDETGSLIFKRITPYLPNTCKYKERTSTPRLV